MVGTLDHTVSLDLWRGQPETKVSHAGGLPYFYDSTTIKTLDLRFGWFLWLAINHACCYKPLQRGASTVYMIALGASMLWNLMLGTFLDPVLCTSFLGWFLPVSFHCLKPSHKYNSSVEFWVLKKISLG